MNFASLLTISLIIATFSAELAAEEAGTLRFGATEVTFDYEQNKSGSTILTLIAQKPETNDLRRGLKNTDQRRLSKLGYLVYQCKLLLQPADNVNSLDDNTPALTSRNFSLFTGVNLPLGIDQRVGIQINALQAFKDTSLFNVGLADIETFKTRRETLGEGSPLNLKQFDLGLLSESDLFETSESVEITARFPIFQMAEPVTEWRYHFDLVDFKKAVRYIDENCTPAGFRVLLKGEA